VSIKSDPQVQQEFLEWMTEHAKKLDFIWPRGEHVLVRQLYRWMQGRLKDTGLEAPDEASLGRYFRPENTVLPTPERARAIATAFGEPAIDLLTLLRYVLPEDYQVRKPLADEDR